MRVDLLSLVPAADIDLVKRQLCVRQSDWNGQVGTPERGRLRYLPLTERLAAALAEHRHLRSIRVLCQDDGTPFTRQIVQNRMCEIPIDR